MVLLLPSYAVGSSLEPCPDGPLISIDSSGDDLVLNMYIFV